MSFGDVKTTGQGVVRWRALVTMAIPYFLAAYLTLRFGTDAQGIVAIWPANAIFLAACLRERTWLARLPVIVTCYVLGVIAGVSVSGNTMSPPIFCLANVVEVGIATWGLYPVIRGRDGFGRPGALGRFILWAGFAAPFASAAIGAWVSWVLHHGDFIAAFKVWYLSDALGLLIVTPTAYAMITRQISQRLARASWRARVELAVLLLLTFLTSYLVFGVATYPLVFLLFVPLIMTAFMTGWLGTQLALMIVVVVATAETLAGHGPVAMFSGDPITHALHFQFVMAAMILTMMPVAVALGSRKAITEKLVESERSLRLLAAQSPVLLLDFRRDGVCVRGIGAAMSLLGRQPDSLSGQRMEDICPDGATILGDLHQHALREPGRLHVGEFYIHDMGEIWIEATFRTAIAEDGGVNGTLAMLHNVTARKEQELALSRFAITDSLTGLLNRAGLSATLHDMLRRAHEGTICLAVIDIDRFKQINDGNGHQSGDLVLKEVSERILHQMRAGDVVGRLGGDEFVVMIEAPSAKVAHDICDRIVTAVNANPVVLADGSDVSVAISCGLATYKPGMTAEALFHEADLALYEAKRRGRNQMVAAA